MIILLLLLLCLIIGLFFYGFKHAPSDYFVRDYRTNNVYYYTDFDCVPKRVKILDTYIDENGRHIIEFIYIDEDGNHISAIHNKSLYNFMSMLNKK